MRGAGGPRPWIPSSSKRICFICGFKFPITVGAELLSALSRSIHTLLQHDSLGQGIQMSLEQAPFCFLFLIFVQGRGRTALPHPRDPGGAFQPGGSLCPPAQCQGWMWQLLPVLPERLQPPPLSITFITPCSLINREESKDLKAMIVINNHSATVELILHQGLWKERQRGKGNEALQ